MSEIRQYKHPEDFEAVKAFCETEGIAIPSTNEKIFLAWNNSKLIGITGLKVDYRIEPLIAYNPLTANTLGRMIEGYAVGTGVTAIVANVPGSNEKHINQLVKDGFSVVETNITILEKHYG